MLAKKLKRGIQQVQVKSNIHKKLFKAVQYNEMEENVKVNN